MAEQSPLQQYHYCLACCGAVFEPFDADDKMCPKCNKPTMTQLVTIKEVAAFIKKDPHITVRIRDWSALSKAA